MRTQGFSAPGLLKAALPYVWGFAAASAADSVIDVKTLFLPALAVIAALGATLLVLRLLLRRQAT